MIRNQWYVILESKEIRPGKAVGVTRLGEKLVLWRTAGGKLVCMADRCPHLGAQLSQGKVCAANDRLSCPFHGFEYEPDGQCCYIPAIGKNGVPPKAMKVETYPTYEAHGLIWIYWGEPQGEISPPRWFDDLDDTFPYGSYHNHWPVHYSRMVENQLDVLHLPFVHYNTIGRGNKMVIDGPLYTLQDDLLRFWTFNRIDDGTPPRKPEDLTPPEHGTYLEFIFPNIWQNRINDDMRVFAAFVPVDEENGLFYMRYYQRFVRMPILRDLVNFIGVLGSLYIANQDRRVVSRQMPKKTDLNMREKPIASDRLIIAYRRRRKELQEMNPQRN